jgi:hypothetical protein
VQGGGKLNTLNKTIATSFTLLSQMKGNSVNDYFLNSQFPLEGATVITQPRRQKT